MKKRVLLTVVMASLLIIIACSKAPVERPAPEPPTTSVEDIGEDVNETSPEDINFSEIDEITSSLDELDW